MRETTAMNDRKLLKWGSAGTIIAAICCFTPALLILLPALGLAAWLAWADYVLWPMLIVSAGVTLFAWLRMRRRRACGVPEAGR
ncbi:mercury resistance system transport protein MerF [Inmirania thermothiophila]|uniref:Mercuric ion transport protein n=1 Tax=Inmirania thermothiophila TaxID=1750597 RepID=A0A3N1Y1B7_9GAMM|nr:mercury resistance system transport protein MerF [Inmirania thermothiophila]ROR32341.1 mercuric ion transport protein [Inmirania thermothiophila]